MNPKTIGMYAGGVIAGLIIAYVILVYGQGNILVSIGVAVGVVVIGILYEVLKKRKPGKKHEENKDAHEEPKDGEKKDGHGDKKDDNDDHQITAEPLY